LNVAQGGEKEYIEHIENYKHLHSADKTGGNIGRLGIIQLLETDKCDESFVTHTEMVAILNLLILATLPSALIVWDIKCKNRSFFLSRGSN